MGQGGAMDFVDQINKRAKDQFTGWKAFRPHERKLVDPLTASPLHVIVTMRVATAYEEFEDPVTHKKKRQKVGLKPVQREGLEYEFDLVASMEDDNTLVVDKSRCPDYHGKIIEKPKAEHFRKFYEWLGGEKRPVEKPVPSIAAPPAVAPVAAPAPARATQQPAAAPIPQGAQKLLQECRGKDATLQVIAKLGQDLMELNGESGVNFYDLAIATVLEGPLESLKSSGQARTLIVMLYAELERLQKGAAA
jgi:hypothetical protein